MRSGWLGGCFSCCEILGVLHHAVASDVDHVVLSKGHAAAMQYACLYADGQLTLEQLSRYKDGVGGLEAHADILVSN